MSSSTPFAPVGVLGKNRHMKLVSDQAGGHSAASFHRSHEAHWKDWLRAFVMDRDHPRKTLVGSLLVVLLVLVFMLSSRLTSNNFAAVSKPSHINSADDGLRILYIVTSLAEFNTGKRDTIKGQDRLAEVLVPTLVDSVTSIQQMTNAQVDVFLIVAYQLKPEREAWIREHLPAGLIVWGDACPLGYEARHSPNKVIDNTRALARQHRYVIRDYLPYYDLFIAMEDDMRITGHAVQQYMKMTHTLENLLADAPEQVKGSGDLPFKQPLSKLQLNRMIPGFVRVEVLLDPQEHPAQSELDPIPLDYDWDGQEQHFDPRPCCHLQPSLDLPAQQQRPLPEAPDKDLVVIWETNIRAMAVRQLFNTQKFRESDPCVTLLPGPGKKLQNEEMTIGYWSGDDGAFGKDATKPSGGEPKLIAQQGGWMMTARQIERMHDENLCQGSFLPPFDHPVYVDDGQASMNVEFWSGGYQLLTGVKGGCNMQRVVDLSSAEAFSKHLIYHTANNKQRQLSKERMLRAEHFWAQLNSVRKAALSKMQ